jgi:hypothetical protein
MDREKMKAIVSKKTGEVLLFCEQSEIDLLKNIKDILIMDAVPCKCGHGWLVKRKREKDENY